MLARAGSWAFLSAVAPVALSTGGRFPHSRVRSAGAVGRHTIALRVPGIPAEDGDSLRRILHPTARRLGMG